MLGRSQGSRERSTSSRAAAFPFRARTLAPKEDESQIHDRRVAETKLTSEVASTAIECKDQRPAGLFVF